MKDKRFAFLAGAGLVLAAVLVAGGSMGGSLDNPPPPNGDITDVFSCPSGDCSDIAVGATDRLDFSGNDSSTITEGLILPQHPTACAGGVAEGQVCWDAAKNALFIGGGSALMRVSPGGVQTLWLPADEWTPTATSGANAYASAETTALRPDVNHLGFATAADDHAQMSVAFSTAWDLGTVTFQVYWSHAAATTFGVTRVLQCVSVADGGTIDVAFGTAVTLNDTGGTTEDLFVTAESGAVTCAGTPADGELTYFQLFRDVSDANDDLDVNADMIGVKIFFTTDTSI